LNIGAYNIGIKVDHANDRVAIGNVINSIFWDSWEGDHVNTIDSWVKDHSTALLVNRVDSLEVHNFNLFIRNTGLLITDSTDAAQNPRCGYGSGSDINLDTVQFGIIVDCSNTAGFVFTNLVVGSGNGGEAAVQVRGTGSLPPEVLVESGSIRGSWSLGPFPTPAAGHITVANIIGYDLP
jgi:hypothetical protein